MTRAKGAITIRKGVKSDFGMFEIGEGSEDTSLEFCTGEAVGIGDGEEFDGRGDSWISGVGGTQIVGTFGIILCLGGLAVMSASSEYPRLSHLPLKS